MELAADERTVGAGFNSRPGVRCGLNVLVTGRAQARQHTLWVRTRLRALHAWDRADAVGNRVSTTAGASGISPFEPRAGWFLGKKFPSALACSRALRTEGRGRPRKLGTWASLRFLRATQRNSRAGASWRPRRSRRGCSQRPGPERRGRRRRCRTGPPTPPGRSHRPRPGSWRGCPRDRQRSPVRSRP